MDWVAFGILIGFLTFAIIMFLVIWRQSRSSSSSEDTNDKDVNTLRDPTPLYHAPRDAQESYISLQKLRSAGGDSSSLSLDTLKKPEVPRYKQRLFYEDTARSDYSRAERMC
ncbi:hypothetical protein LTR66_016827 [Elasticomyces elasticus]|nr:hypothetical protein LTR66_016827 [Elasticomyces elasticus]